MLCIPVVLVYSPLHLRKTPSPTSVFRGGAGPLSSRFKSPSTLKDQLEQGRDPPALITDSSAFLPA